MNRQVLSLTFCLLVFAAAASSSPAGEQPGPGLEIFDAGSGYGGGTNPEAMFPTVPPDSLNSGQVYIPPPNEYLQAQPMGVDPYAAPVQGMEYTAPAYPNGGAGAIPPPPLQAQAQPQPQAQPPSPGVAQYPVDPYAAAIAALNGRNSNFPGLAGAAAQGNLRAAGDIIWQVLRERRVVAATLTRGPGGSAGAASPFEVQQAFSSINHQPNPSQPESPLLPAQRINIILDAFTAPVVDDYGFGGGMERALERLHSDIYAIRTAIPDTSDEAAYQELSRTYIRAATTCDFFVFPSKELAQDIDSYLRRSSPLFYPDGASIAGDVGGVTGNLLQDLLMLDYYTQDDSWFRRTLSPMWRILSEPARYAVALALPDNTLPRFGPRGSRELTSSEVATLRTIFPKSGLQVNRIGLAASHSFPESSTAKSYGGIFASRSGAEPSARYLAIRFGPMGIMREVPAHQDFGSMVLMSRNIRYLVDAGGYGGPAAEASSHSTLSLGGAHVLPTTYNEPGQPVETIWRTNASLDYASDQAAFIDGKTWQRSMVYVKDLPGESRADYWVVLDHVEMKGDNQPRQAQIRFQLAPGIQVYNESAGVLATANFGSGPGLRIFPIDANAELTVSEGGFGLLPSQVYDVAGGAYAAPTVAVTRTLTGDSTTATLLYPTEDMNHRPERIERDSDLIRGRTGTIVVDHGRGRIDVIAWAPPGAELVTPTLNLVMSADLGVFRIRNGKIVRMNFINMQRFQAKEPNGGMWSMRVAGAAQTLTLEPEQGGGWQVLSDPANHGGANLLDINLGPAISGRRLSIRPGELRRIGR